MASILADDSQAVFVAVRERGGLSGFAEVSIHPHALGCQTHPVGYLEGWWVDPDLRRTGLGRQLVAAAENWPEPKAAAKWLPTPMSATTSASPLTSPSVISKSAA